MKRSDKVLLTAFLLGVFILLGVQAALYAKYKKGDFVYVADSWQRLLVTVPANDVSYISVDHADGVTIEAADTTQLQWRRSNEEDSSLQYRRVGDTLFITGRPDEDNRYNRYANVTLKLAAPVTLSLRSADMSVGRTSAKSFPDLRINSDSSNLNFSSREAAGTLQFGLLQINAVRNSKISLANSLSRKLMVQLSESELDETAATTDSLVINADPASKIGLRMLNLSKAKIITTNE